MLHTTAWFKSTDRAAVDSDTTPIAGTADNIQNNHIALPADMYLERFCAMGISLSRARLDSPYLRKQTVFDLWPFERAAIPSEFVNIWRGVPDGKYIKKGEELVLKLSGNGVTGTNENWTGVGFFSDGNTTAPVRSDYTIVQATATTTLVANTWTNCVLTFSETLGAGSWQIIGFQGFSANGQAARLVIPQQSWRPGCIMGNTNLGLVPCYDFMEGNLGVLGQFNNSVPPSVEVLANAADTAETFWFKLVQM